MSKISAVFGAKMKTSTSLIWSGKARRYWGLERRKRNGENRAEMLVKGGKNGGEDVSKK